MDQYIDFKSGVQHHIRNKFLEANGNSLPEAVEGATDLAAGLNDFIRYCFDNFGDTLKERYRCSIGILAKIDSVDHPERYKSYNMSSMFDVHLCAGRIMAKTAIQQEDLPLAKIKNQVLTSLKEKQFISNHRQEILYSS